MQYLSPAIKTALLTVLFIFISLYAFSRLFGPIPFSVNSVNTTKTDLFTVSGVGEATAVPDTALMSIGVTKTASTVNAAQNEVNVIINSITDGLKNLGINENKIKTTNYSIQPNYDYTDGRNTITNYSVSQNLRVEVTPLEKANQALDLASANGGNMIGNIQFITNDDEKMKLENSAREDAIKKAKQKAQDIAGTAGIRLGKLINVQEQSNSYPQPYFDTMRSLAIDEATQKTELQPGENTITISVTLYYETL